HWRFAFQDRTVEHAENCCWSHAELRGETPVFAGNRNERNQKYPRGEWRVEEDMGDQDSRQAVKPSAEIDAEDLQLLPDPAGAPKHRNDAEDNDDRRQ